MKNEKQNSASNKYVTKEEFLVHIKQFDAHIKESNKRFDNIDSGLAELKQLIINK